MEKVHTFSMKSTSSIRVATSPSFLEPSIDTSEPNGEFVSLRLGREKNTSVC